jgi:hypothetical protein
VISDLPVILVRNFHLLGHGSSFGKINQPTARIVAIVHKQQTTTNDLVSLEKVRMLERGTNRLKALNIFPLYENKGTLVRTPLKRIKSISTSHQREWITFEELSEHLADVLPRLYRLEVFCLKVIFLDALDAKAQVCRT